MNQRHENDPAYVVEFKEKFKNTPFLEQIEHLTEHECDKWIQHGVVDFNRCLENSYALYEAFQARESLQCIETGTKFPAEPLQFVPESSGKIEPRSMFECAFARKQNDEFADHAFAEILHQLKEDITKQNDEKVAPLFQAINMIDSNSPTVERKQADAGRELYLVDEKDMAAVTASGTMLEAQRLIYDAAVFINLITPNAAVTQNCNPGAMMLHHYVKNASDFNLDEQDLHALQAFQLMLKEKMMTALKHEVLNLEYQKLHDRMRAHLSNTIITQESKLAAVGETQDNYYVVPDDFKNHALAEKIAKIVGLKNKITALEETSIAISEAYFEAKTKLTQEKCNWPAPFITMADHILNQEPASDTDRERIRGEITQYLAFVEEQKEGDFAAWKEMQANIEFLKQQSIGRQSTDLENVLRAFDNLCSNTNQNESVILTKDYFLSTQKMLAQQVDQVKTNEIRARCAFMLAQLSDLGMPKKDREKEENKLFFLQPLLGTDETIKSMQALYLSIAENYFKLSQQAYFKLVPDTPNTLVLPENLEADVYFKFGMLYQCSHTTTQSQMDWEHLNNQFEHFCEERPANFDSSTTSNLNELVKQVETIQNRSKLLRFQIRQLNDANSSFDEKCTIIEAILKDLSGGFVIQVQEQLTKLKQTFELKCTQPNKLKQVADLDKLIKDLNQYKQSYYVLKLHINNCFMYSDISDLAINRLAPKTMQAHGITRIRGALVIAPDKDYSKEQLDGLTTQFRDMVQVAMNELGSRNQLDDEIRSYQRFLRNRLFFEDWLYHSVTSQEDKKKRLIALKDRFIKYQDDDMYFFSARICFNPGAITTEKLSREDLDRFLFPEVKERFDGYYQNTIASAFKRIQSSLNLISAYNRLLFVNGMYQPTEDIINILLGSDNFVTMITNGGLDLLEKYGERLKTFTIKAKQIEHYINLVKGVIEPSLCISLLGDMSNGVVNQVNIDLQTQRWDYCLKSICEFKALLPDVMWEQFDKEVTRINDFTIKDFVNNYAVCSILEQNEGFIRSLKNYQDYYTWSRQIKDDLVNMKTNSGDSDLTNSIDKTDNLIRVLDLEFKTLTSENQIEVNAAFKYLVGVANKTDAYDEATWSHHKTVLQGILPKTSNTWRLFKTWGAIVLGAALISGAIALACVSFGSGAVLIPVVAGLTLKLAGSALAVTMGTVGVAGLASLAYGTHRLFQPSENNRKIYYETLEEFDPLEMNQSVP